MSCVRNSAGSVVTSGPLSIFTSFNIFISLFIIVSLRGQTGLCSSDSHSPLKNQTTDNESESALALLAQWAKANSGNDIDTQPSSSSILSSITSLLASGIGRGDTDLDFTSADLDNYHDSKVITEYSQPTEGWYPNVLTPISHDLYHHHSEVKEKGSPFWEWLHSDAMSTAIPLILFGVIPILIGLIPFIVILSNFWLIFNKIHTLHTLFWGLLGSHDDSYGSYGSGSYGWDGWSRSS